MVGDAYTISRFLSTFLLTITVAARAAVFPLRLGRQKSSFIDFRRGREEAEHLVVASTSVEFETASTGRAADTLTGLEIFMMHSPPVQDLSSSALYSSSIGVFAFDACHLKFGNERATKSEYLLWRDSFHVLSCIVEISSCKFARRIEVL